MDVFCVIIVCPPREKGTARQNKLHKTKIIMSVVYKIIAEFFQVLLPISITVVLPVLIVWLVGRDKQNKTNRKAEIMLKALENGATLDPDFFGREHESRTIKERLLGRLTAACITSLVGLAFILVGIFMMSRLDWAENVEIVILTFMIGGILIAVGMALFIVYFTGKRLLCKEIAAEEKRLSEGR